MLLTPSELRELTGCARRSDQAEWLSLNGIPFRLDGVRLLVSKAHAEAWLGGVVVVSREPDLSGVK